MNEEIQNKKYRKEILEHDKDIIKIEVNLDEIVSSGSLKDLNELFYKALIINSKIVSFIMPKCIELGEEKRNGKQRVRKRTDISSESLSDKGKTNRSKIEEVKCKNQYRIRCCPVPSFV